ncbi:MAG TPA: pilus assembly protein TadG-related protein [Mycobacteriales bacterium]|jgi:Flp pilus assembly protein TadG|nr:pilus assembly protein TadG-related protein [Mycobacteriales bacterium]
MRSRRDRGSAALFVAIFAPAMIFMAGLVIDGGAGLAAKQRAADIAESAARAAAGQCDVATLRDLGDCRVFDSNNDARQAAAQYANNLSGVTWTMAFTRPVGDARGGFHGVTVTVQIKFQTTLLGIVPKFKELEVNATAEAIAVTGL